MLSWLGRVLSWTSGKMDSVIAGLVHDVVSGFYGFLHTLFGDVITEWNEFFHAIYDFRIYITSAIEGVENAFHYIFKVWIPHTISWINTTIIAPLLQAVAWIAHEGSIIWHYISAPADLVDLIWDALIANLERTAWNTAESLGRFTVSLIVRNLPTLLTVMEDIADALL
jgi:hypothetical protein